MFEPGNKLEAYDVCRRSMNYFFKQLFKIFRHTLRWAVHFTAQKIEVVIILKRVAFFTSSDPTKMISAR